MHPESGSRQGSSWFPPATGSRRQDSGHRHRTLPAKADGSRTCVPQADRLAGTRRSTAAVSDVALNHPHAGSDVVCPTVSWTPRSGVLGLGVVGDLVVDDLGQLLESVGGGHVVGEVRRARQRHFWPARPRAARRVGLGQARATDPPTSSSAPRRRSRGHARATAWSGGAAPGRR